MQDNQVQHPQRVFGYDVIKPVGRGAASFIYAVRRPGSGQVHALKHVVCHEAKEERFVEQVRNEYTVGNQVRCPGLRRPLELLTDGSWLHRVHEVALIMEMFDGVCLEHFRALTLDEAIACGITVARVLHAMHEAGFLHCDMKPANLLMNEHGEFCVIDLGQACPIGTIKRRIQGTPAFMAPEQFHRRPVFTRSDIYNLGATLYWFLTHRALTTACTLDRGANSFLLDAAQPSPHELNSAVPDSLSGLVMKCVRTNPDHRPANMQEVIRPLETISYMLSHAPIGAADNRHRSAGIPNHLHMENTHPAPGAHA